MRELADLRAVEDFKAQNPEGLVIDVRSQADYEDGHMEGALHHPEETILTDLADRDKTLPIAVYCNRGVKSRRVAQSLEAAGFSNIYNYTPGLKG